MHRIPELGLLLVDTKIERTLRYMKKVKVVEKAVMVE